MTLIAALEASDWRVALDRAIARWRETRAMEVATLVDRIAERCAIRPPPLDHVFHAWWMKHALAPYDAATVTTLIAHVARHLDGNDVPWAKVQARWPDDPLVRGCATEEEAKGFGMNWIDRCAAIERWPDDPRIAPCLVEWYGRRPWSSKQRNVHAAMVVRILARLASLADRRVIPRLALMASQGIADAGDVVRAIERRAPTLQADEARELVRWSEWLATSRDRDRLWAETHHGDATRAVLADALIADGDDRGELIALQLSIDRAAAPDRRRTAVAAKLLAAGWDRWMGELAHVLVRQRCEFRGGMLQTIVVGRMATQPWHWLAGVDHRELACVEVVQPVLVRHPTEYAAFLAALPRLRSLTLFDAAIVQALVALGARLPITRLRFARFVGDRDRAAPQHADVLALIASVAPDVEEIVLDGDTLGPQLTYVAALVPTWFAAIAAIEIVPPGRWPEGLDREQLAGLPHVVIRG